MVKEWGGGNFPHTPSGYITACAYIRTFGTVPFRTVNRRGVYLGGLKDWHPPEDKATKFAGELNVYQSNDDTIESCHI